MKRKIISSFKEGPYTFNQELVNCGKELCNKCREGIFHGPYWYMYFRRKGISICKYIGRTLRVPKRREDDMRMREAIRKLEDSPVVKEIVRKQMELFKSEYGCQKEK